MPGCNGHEVLRINRARPAFNQLPVVMLTGSNEPADLEHAYSAGANSFLIKPVLYLDFRAHASLFAGVLASFESNPSPFACTRQASTGNTPGQIRPTIQITSGGRRGCHTGCLNLYSIRLLKYVSYTSMKAIL